MLMPFNMVRTIPAGTTSATWESTGPVADGLRPLLLGDGFSQHIPTGANIAPEARADFGFGEVSLRDIIDLELIEEAMMTGSNPASLRIDGRVRSLVLPMIPAIQETTYFTMVVLIVPSENQLPSSLVELRLESFSYEVNISLSNMAVLTLIKELVRNVAENLEDAANRESVDMVQGLDIPLDSVAPPRRRPVRWSVRCTFMASNTHRTHGVINGIIAHVYGVWNDGRAAVQV